MGIEATSRARVRWPQDQRVGLRGHYQAFRDNRDGSVDYAAPLGRVEAWPDGEGKIGDGLGRDGMGADGYGDGGLGDGMGADGMGMDGFGAGMLAYETAPLADGHWTFAVVGFDAPGNPSPAAAGATAAVTLAGTPKPPASVVAASYDAGADELTMTLGLSPDDEG